MSSENERQARFSENFDHILLGPTVHVRREYKPRGRKKKKGIFPKMSKAKYEELNTSFSKIHSISSRRTKIYKDPKMYFVIGFSDALSWKPVRDVIKNLKVSVVDVLDEKTIKVSLQKEQYELFLYNLRKNHKYIEEMRETVLSEKIEGSLIEELRKQPNQKGWFTFELANLSGIEEPERIESLIIEYVKSNDLGEIHRSYSSKDLLVLSGLLRYRAVEEIAEEIESVTKVFKMPKIEPMTNELSPLSLSSATPIIGLTPETPPAILSPICVIDSGINSGHRLLRDFIEDTYDYSTQDAAPCKDSDGHGSMVSGLTIYGDDIRKNKSPLAKVVMIKNFENGAAIEKDILKVIYETVIRFRFNSRVLGLSFAADGPNPTFTKALDEIVFLNDLVVVSCAGNIKLPLIKQYINNDVGYPEYIKIHKIFFPGDCRNVLTVGSYTEHDSNIVEANSPSPFTRSSPSFDLIKPEVMSCGGNVNAIFSGKQVESFSSVGLGVRSTSNIDSEEYEDIGTSFCSPVIANLAASIISKYPGISAFLVKALILSSCEFLRNRRSEVPDPSIQGFGKPNRMSALYSQNWRVCYLLEDEFGTDDAEKYHRYHLLFPDEADELEVTLVCGKLHTMFEGEKSDYIRLKYTRPGVKFRTPLKSQISLGNSKCFCAHQARTMIRRGSKGSWTIDVIPHFFSLVSNQKLKYACVITVSSSRVGEVYAPIINWLRPMEGVVQPIAALKIKSSSVSPEISH